MLSAYLTRCALFVYHKGTYFYTMNIEPYTYTATAIVHEPTDDEYTDIVESARGFILASQLHDHKSKPFGADGKPRMLVINAWMVHEGRNLNGDAFVKEELKQVVADGLFSPPYAGMIDDDHDFTARGYWYKTSFAYDELARKWGVLATGAIWAWRYSDLADRLIGDMRVRGKIDVSMSVIAGHTEATVVYPGANGEQTKVLHNPVFFTTSLLSVPPGDKFARGKVAESPVVKEELAVADIKQAEDTQPEPVGGSDMSKDQTAVAEVAAAEVAKEPEAAEVVTAEAKAADDETKPDEAAKAEPVEKPKEEAAKAEAPAVKAQDDEEEKPDEAAKAAPAKAEEEAKAEPAKAEAPAEEAAKAEDEPDEAAKAAPVEEEAAKTAPVKAAPEKPDYTTKADAKPNLKPFVRTKAVKDTDPTARKAAKTKLQGYLKASAGYTPPKVEAVKADITEPVATAGVVNCPSDAGPPAPAGAAPEVADVEKTNDLTDRRVKGAMAVNVLRFAKSFWKSSAAVVEFLNNEAIGRNVVTETAGYYEAEALPAANFVAGSFVEHCIASFGGDCAIVAVSGEVKDTPHVTDSVSTATKVNAAFAAHHVKQVAALTAELERSQRHLKEVEATLMSALEDKGRLAEELRATKAELTEKTAQAKLDARLGDMPSTVKAQLKRNPNREDILKYLRTASDQEWALARSTFAMSNHTSFAELSEQEGKLPVGGTAANEGKLLKEFLR